jgi:ABC-2 type transport system ATP-binding protein
MIEVQGLEKAFGTFLAVRGVSFSAQKGEVLGFLGPNGAGKTTTMRMMTGFLTPTAGTIQIAGFDVQAQPVKARKQIGYLPESAPLYGDMTVAEFLRFVAEVRGFSGSEQARHIDAAIERCFLESVRHRSIETLSKGYRQRTCFAQALLHDPDILLLDEPTDGLDPNQKKVARDMIREMAPDKAIILSTHILEEVEAICDRAIVISEGRIVEDDTPNNLRKKSPSYNAVNLRVTAAGEAAQKALLALPDVRSAKVLEAGSGSTSLRLNARDGQPITAAVLDACREQGWHVTEIQTDGGRLDEIFQSLTTTRDTEKEGAA